MTSEQLVQEIGSLWDALTLAAQGAFTNAHPANGHHTPRDASRALEAFSQAAASANTIIGKLTRDYAVRVVSSDTKAMLAIEQERQKAERGVAHAMHQLHVQTARAIRSGNTGGPAALLHDAQGGIGALVGRYAGILRISIRDTSERQWKSPRRLVETIVQGFTVQAAVIAAISNLRADGHQSAMVGDRRMPLSQIEAERHQLFHPNSKELPRATVST